jgi:hypothetical protein
VGTLAVSEQRCIVLNVCIVNGVPAPFADSWNADDVGGDIVVSTSATPTTIPSSASASSRSSYPAPRRFVEVLTASGCA